MFRKILFFLLFTFCFYGFLYSQDCKLSYKCWNSYLQKTMEEINLGSQEREIVQNYIFGHYFIDSPDYQASLIEKKDAPWLLYNNTGGDPYGNFVKTWEFLVNSRKELTLDLIIEVHKMMMSGGVEGIDSSDLGLFRKIYVIGAGQYQNYCMRVSKDVCANIKNDKYANFEEKAVPEAKENPQDKFGIIAYPHITNTDKIMDKVSPEFASEIKKFKVSQIFEEIKGLLISKNPKNDQKIAEMNRRLMEELIKNLFNWYKTSESTIEPIKLASEMQKSFVTIHPFSNGNGRTSRMLLYYILYLNDILLPVLEDPNNDVFSNYAGWEKDVAAGLETSARLYKDVILRLKNKMHLYNSTAVLETYLPKKDKNGNLLTPAYFQKYFQLMKGQFTETVEMEKKWEKRQMISFLKDKFLAFGEKFLSHPAQGEPGLSPVTMDYIYFIKKKFDNFQEFSVFKTALYNKEFLKKTVIFRENREDFEFASVFKHYESLHFAETLAKELEADKNDLSSFESCYDTVNLEIFRENLEADLQASLSAGKSNFLLVQNYRQDTPSLKIDLAQSENQNLLEKILDKSVFAEITFEKPVDGYIAANKLSNHYKVFSNFQNSEKGFLACAIRPESIVTLVLFNKSGNAFKIFKRENSFLNVYSVNGTKITKTASFNL